jgi:hypothetical protein
MRSTCLTGLAFIMLGSWLVASEPIAIGDRRELFVDHWLIDSLDGAELFLHEPRDEGNVLKFDQPWEGLFSGYGTILHVDGKYQLYYRGRPELSTDGGDEEFTCYAESMDGLHWTRPTIGRFAYQGSTHNNIVLANAAPVTHNFSPFYDTRPDCDSQQRYKAIGGTAKSGLIAYVSADGVNWQKFQSEPVIHDSGWVFDSQNVAFWSPSESCYVSYYRRSVGGSRAIARTTSPDFIQWTGAQQMRYSNTSGEVPANHLYTNQTHPYFRAPHIYLATAARFMPGRKVVTDAQAAEIGVHPKYFNDSSDAVLMTSRGGDLYDCTFNQGFVRPGIGLSNWVSRTNYPVLNVVQTGPTEMSLYTNQDYGQASAHLHRYALRLDGFASLRSRRNVGEATTKPLTFTGHKLSINFATSAAGGVRIEIQEPDGTPIPGYSLNEADVIIGNEIEKQVSWKGQADLSSLIERPVRLRFVLEDADLYSFQFLDNLKR